MMRPKPRDFVPAMTRRIVWKGELRLIARIWSHFSTGKGLDSRYMLDPGIVHKDILLPNVSSVVSIKRTMSVGCAMSAGT